MAHAGPLAAFTGVALLFAIVVVVWLLTATVTSWVVPVSVTTKVSSISVDHAGNDPTTADSADGVRPWTRRALSSSRC